MELGDDAEQGVVRAEMDIMLNSRVSPGCMYVRESRLTFKLYFDFLYQSFACCTMLPNVSNRTRNTHRNTY